jgi:hypothetical protein
MTRTSLTCTLILLTASQVTWDGPTPFTHLGGRCGPARWCLGTASVVRQEMPNPTGGPQALEGYTHVTHKSGTVALAIGTLGNVELGGASGTVTERAYALAGGFVVTGPGVVNHPVTLSLGQPKRHGGYEGAMNVKDPVYIEFDNGWSFRPSGADLLLCDPGGRCRTL